LVLVTLQLASREFLEKVENGARALRAQPLLPVVRAGAILDDRQELVEFNHLGAVFVDELHDLLHLLPVIDQTQSDQWVFKFIDTDRLRSFVIDK